MVARDTTGLVLQRQCKNCNCFSNYLATVSRRLAKQLLHFPQWEGVLFVGWVFGLACARDDTAALNKTRIRELHTRHTIPKRRSGLIHPFVHSCCRKAAGSVPEEQIQPLLFGRHFGAGGDHAARYLRFSWTMG